MNRKEYLLSCLAEECCEVGQMVSKALRFSTEEVYAGTGTTNAQRLVDELHDLIAVATILEREGVLVGVQPSEERIEAKRLRIERYMALSREYGALRDLPDPTSIPFEQLVEIRDGKPVWLR